MPHKLLNPFPKNFYLPKAHLLVVGVIQSFNGYLLTWE